MRAYDVNLEQKKSDVIASVYRVWEAYDDITRYEKEAEKQTALRIELKDMLANEMPEDEAERAVDHLVRDTLKEISRKEGR